MTEPSSEWRKTSFVFIRHAESFNNCTYEMVREKFGNSLSPQRQAEEVEKLHSADCGISPKGEEQATKLQEYISSGGLSNVISSSDEWHLYSSPLKRCLLTAQYISAGFGSKETTVVPFMFESDGCYDSLPNGDTIGRPGLSASEVTQLFPNFSCMEGMENGWYKLPKKETVKQFRERTLCIGDWLWSLHEMSPQERGFATGAVLSVHGNLIAGIISALVKTPVLAAHCNTGVTHIELWSDATGQHKIPVIKFMNCVKHLQSKPSLIAGGEAMGDHYIQDFISTA